MANQVEVTKLTGFIATGIPTDQIGVTKLNMFVLVVPSSGDDGSNRQGHVTSHIITRSS